MCHIAVHSLDNTCCTSWYFSTADGMSSCLSEAPMGMSEYRMESSFELGQIEILMSTRYTNR